MHHEVLTKRAAELFKSLSLFPGFYLAGGTALALQIGHRVSVDFDLFSDKDIERSLLPRVQRAFSDAASIAPLINNTDELTLFARSLPVGLLPTSRLGCVRSQFPYSRVNSSVHLSSRRES
jgi:hypothetical protein